MPPQASREIYRERLLQRMKTPADTSLVLVRAAGGYGKTSLVSSYVQNKRAALPLVPT